ncbi:MAG: hypothetical protein IPP42_14095 [Saprospiraceae bacterium]|nr:hypothetical protein [Saprospiraceae bacterium]
MPSDWMWTCLMFIMFYLNRIHALENESILSNLNIGEKQIMANAFSVAKSSAQYWLPTSLGGENKYHLNKKFDFNQVGDQLEMRSFSWGKLIGSDIAGMVEGATIAVASTGGAAALPNPVFGGVPTASVVGVITGAFQSGIYAIQN